MKIVLLSFLVLILLDTGIATGVEKPEIRWGFSDITALPARTKKYLFSEDQHLYRKLIEALPEYTHTSFNASVIRIERELKKGPRTCFPASSNADARKEFTYLTPLYISPSPILVMKKTVAKKFQNKNGKVSLRKLMQDKTLRPLFTEARSYGPILDKVIREEDTWSDRQITRPFVQNVVDIISHNRGDYAIEYSFIIDEYIASSSRNKDVTTVSIEEIPVFNIQYLACSKTPEGLTIIEKADQLLQTRSTDPNYKNEILAFSKTHDNKEFNKALTEFLKDRNKSQIIRQ